MKAYAIYRSRSLMVFANAEERGEYIRGLAKFDPPEIITAEQAECWQPSGPQGKTVYVWREAGRWKIKAYVGKRVRPS